MPDEVIVRIPASTAHLAVARAVASSLAARLDFTYDRITDLHIALDEACSRIVAESDPPSEQLQITFSIRDSGVQVLASGDSPSKQGVDFLNPWSHLILDALAEDLQAGDQDGVACVGFFLPGAALS